MSMSDNEFGGVFVLSVATLFFASVTLCIRTSYKMKNDTSKGSCGWGFINWDNTRDVKVEEDIELGKKKKIRNRFGGSSELASIEFNSDLNSELNSESKR